MNNFAMLDFNIRKVIFWFCKPGITSGIFVDVKKLGFFFQVTLQKQDHAGHLDCEKYFIVLQIIWPLIYIVTCQGSGVSNDPLLLQPVSGTTEILKNVINHGWPGTPQYNWTILLSYTNLVVHICPFIVESY